MSDRIRRGIATVVFSLSACGVSADWVYVGGSSDSGDSYIDPATIKKTHNGYRVWELDNYTKFKSIMGLSTVGINEVDCEEEKSRYIQLTNYDGHMGMGDVVYSSPEPLPWNYHRPGSIGGAVLKAICAHGTLNDIKKQ